MPIMARNYCDAIELLNTRPHYVSNLNVKGWLAKLGHDTKDLPIIHITGTKGKGSTAAYTDILLRTHARRTCLPLKVGLYTSPHLITERERIRIDFEPIPEEVYAKYFFRAWDTLCVDALRAGNDGPDVPGYHQLNFLTSVLAFKGERVDLAIYEVHCGGINDVTNVFDEPGHGPVACGFTTMALDHIGVLGHSVADVAWHKSGIMKPGSPSFSVMQPDKSATQVLTQEAAKHRGVKLSFVPILEDLLPQQDPKLHDSTQRINLSLAVKLADAYLQRWHHAITPQDVAIGVALFEWPGRFQTVQKGMNKWFLDCAHNALSLPIAMKWFGHEMDATRNRQASSRPRVLIFAQQAKRDARVLREVMAQANVDYQCGLDKIILTSSVYEGAKVWTDEDTLAWADLFGHAPSLVMRTAGVDEAVLATRGYTNGVDVLVTGSVHTVGEALAVLQ